MGNYIIMILVLIAGWYLFLQAHKDLDEFYRHVKAKKMVQLIGRRKTRKVYMSIGIYLVVISVYMFLSQTLLSEWKGDALTEKKGAAEALEISVAALYRKIKNKV